MKDAEFEPEAFMPESAWCASNELPYIYDEFNDMIVNQSEIVF